MSKRTSSYGSSYTEGTSDTTSICSNSTMPTQYGDPDDGLHNPYHTPVPRGLPCEFLGFGCEHTFGFSQVDTNAWIEHIITDHLGDKLPSKAICWFCDTFHFDYRARENCDRRQNFEDRMWHIREHFIEEGKTVNDIRPDFHMLEHLHCHKYISEDTYIRCMRWNDLSCPREEMKHVRNRNFVPPEIEARNRRSQSDAVDMIKDERQRKKAQGQKGKEPRGKHNHHSMR